MTAVDATHDATRAIRDATRDATRHAMWIAAREAIHDTHAAIWDAIGELS